MAIILMVLLGFTLDIARAYYSFQVIKDAAGEGAYFGSVHPTWDDNISPSCPDPHNVAYRVRHAAPGGLVDLSGAAVTVAAPSTAAGSLITVSVTVNYQLVAPFTGAFIGSQSLPLTATSSARILAPPDAACPS